MPFDGKRMIYGGFESIVDERQDGTTGYVDGYLLPVPEGKKEAYRALAQKAAGKFKEYGAVRVVEAWGDDVPEGKVTDYQRAVKAEDGEGIIYSYVEWPDKETRDKGWERMMSDPDMQPGRRHAVRRQAHVLGRLPPDHRRISWTARRPDGRRALISGGMAMTLQGSCIWYELMTSDADGSKAFYDRVVGWTIQTTPWRQTSITASSTLPTAA